ncbi:MAG: hypothetical protein SGILL_007998 [Bacillariaceae sp.]
MSYGNFVSSFATFFAHCSLEEYLQELAGLSGGDGDAHGVVPTNHHPRDDLNPSNADEVPNFAHAALILQNSSHIYSRKVEYLHSLVYKALQDFFQATAAASSASRKSSSGRKTADADIEEFFEFDPHENFLLLDDVVPEDITHSKINLKGEDEEDDDDDSGIGGNTPNTTSRRDRLSSGTNRNNTTTRLSLGGLSVTRLERSALGGGFSSTVSQQQQRALLGILNNGTLRLVDGQCDVDDVSGVLLMPGSQTGRSSSLGHDDGLANTPQAQDDFASGNPRDLFNAGGENDQGAFDASAGYGDYGDDDDNDGPGFIMNDDDSDDMRGPDEQVTTVPFARSSAGDDSNKRVTFAETTKESDTGKPKKKDPWALLDPHSNGNNYVPKPLKKGMTYKLPEGVSKPPSECVTGARTNRIIHPKAQSLTQPTLRPSVAVETFRVANGKQLVPEFEVSNFGLAYGDEFLYIAKENAKLKAAKRRADRKKERQENANGDRATDGQAVNNAQNDYDDDDDFGGGFDFGGGDDENDDYENDNNLGNTGIQSMDNLFREDASDGEDAFAKGAEKFALSTKLTERVGKWQAKLAPILEDEERKASFDIHKYSEMLIANAKDSMQLGKRKSGASVPSSAPVEFGAVTKGCTKSDVCRFFLASLSLANAGNLKIDRDQQAGAYCFEVQSYTLEKPMDTYLAPSVTT